MKTLMFAAALLAASPAIAQQRPAVVLNYSGSVLTLGDSGRIITLNGRSIDTLTRAQILAQLHEFATKFLASQGR